jgi:hypothetical protein
MLFQWRVLGKNGTGDWGTATDWEPTGIPGEEDVAAIIRGTVVEDVNVPVGSTAGVSVGAFAEQSGGNMVIGDAAGDNRAILTFGNYQNSWIVGTATVYGASSGPSELQGGTGGTNLFITSSGVLNLDGGALISDNNLFVEDGGTINLLDGTIGRSSAQAQDKLTMDVDVVGVGTISAANSYGGSLNYKGLVTNNYGVVDAVNSSANTAGIAISGGVFNNYGTLEAAPTGSFGSSGLYIDDGAIVQNVSSGSISTGTDGFVQLQSGEIIDGQISGTLYVQGSGNTLSSTSGGSLHLDASTYVTGDLNIGGAGVINDAYLEVDGNVVVKNTFANNINGVIDVYRTFTTAAVGGVDNSGEIIANEGTVTFNSSYSESANETLIEDDGIMRFNVATSNVITFGPGGGTLVLDDGATTGALKDFDLGNNYPAPSGDVLNFRDVAFSSNETGTLTQDGQTALLQVGAYVEILDGVYTTSTSPITFGVGNNGSGFLALAEGPHSSTSVVVYP